jgi:hypothetical protein
VSLNQHSTQQAWREIVQRNIFHLPGLAAVRDSLERDFAEQVAVPKRSQSWRRPKTAPCSTRCGATVAEDETCQLVMVNANHPDLADEVWPFGVPFIHVPARREFRHSFLPAFIGAAPYRRAKESYARTEMHANFAPFGAPVYKSSASVIGPISTSGNRTDCSTRHFRFIVMGVGHPRYPPSGVDFDGKPCGSCQLAHRGLDVSLSSPHARKGAKRAGGS